MSNRQNSSSASKFGDEFIEDWKENRVEAKGLVNPKLMFYMDKNAWKDTGVFDSDNKRIYKPSKKEPPKIMLKIDGIRDSNGNEIKIEIPALDLKNAYMKFEALPEFNKLLKLNYKVWEENNSEVKKLLQNVK